jgi:hypothetical protein
MNSYIVVVEAIAKIQDLSTTEVSNADLVEEVKKLAVTLSLANEYRYYILICGLFSKDRNIVKFWTKHEQAFLDLVAMDGKLGVRHLFQSII